MALQIDANGNIVVSGNTITGVSGNAAPNTGAVGPGIQSSFNQPSNNQVTNSAATSGSTPQTTPSAPTITPQQQMSEQLNNLRSQAVSLQNFLQDKAQNGEVSSKDAISALNTSDTNPGVLNGSIPSTVSGKDQGTIQALLDQMNAQIKNLESAPIPSYTELYKNLYNQPDFTGTSLAQYGQQIAGLKNTELGMSQQVAGQGQGFGFMTAEQQQGITNQRNQAIDNHIQALANLAGLQQNYVDTIMKTTGEDANTAAARAAKIFNLNDSVAKLLNTMDNQDFRKQIMVANLQNATTNSEMLRGLRETEIQLNNLKLQGGGLTAADNADLARQGKVQSFLSQNVGKDGFVSSNSYLDAFQQFLATGGKRTDFSSLFPATEFLTRNEIDKLPSSVPEMNDIKYQADLQDGIQQVATGGLDAQEALKKLNSAYPSKATETKNALAPFQ